MTNIANIERTKSPIGKAVLYAEVATVFDATLWVFTLLFVSEEWCLSSTLISSSS